ncbi:MAG: prolipoprotein diacylglyceryl transferase [Phycisphaerae bacterium]
MEFPIYFHVFGLRVHPHPVMEGIAYGVGLGAMLVARRRRRELGGERDWTQVLWLTAGAAVGALVGAKVLAWIEGPSAPTMDNFLTGGKTIVGGLAGGWAGTEVAKFFLGVKRRTGDAWVLPLCCAIAIGRWGCFLTGLSDNTYGVKTGLPWGVDFGDGPRHPTQLYESGFAVLLLIVLWWVSKRRWVRRGDLFRVFMAGYMGFRFLVEFLKPTKKIYLGLSAIQVVSLVVCGVAVFGLVRRKDVCESTSARAVGDGGL